MGNGVSEPMTAPAPRALDDRTTTDDSGAAPASRPRPARLVTAAAALLALVALVLAALGPGRPASAGPERGVTIAAPDEVAAILLSGYSAGGDPVGTDTPQVLAASLQVANPTDVDQRYALTVTFAGPDGRTLLQRRLHVDVAGDQFATRQLFTQTERPAGDVSVHVTANRAVRR